MAQTETPMQLKFGLLVIISLLFFPSIAKAEDGLARTTKAELLRPANKARTAYTEGNYDEAEIFWKEALTIAEKTDLLSVVDCLCGLSKVKSKQADFAESDRLYELAMRNLETHTKDQNNYLYADYLPDLAALYFMHGKQDQAGLIYQKLLDIRTNKEPIQGSSSNKDIEIIKAEEAYARYLKATNHPDLATEHETKAAGLKYKLQQAAE